MTVYLVGILLSLFLIYYADSQKFTGRETRISIVIALLIPCLIAGLRDKTIGTDVQVYVEPLFQTAQSAETFVSFYNAEFYKPTTWSYDFVNEFEIGFVALTYIIAKLFNSMPVLLFAIQALTVIPIYKGLRTFGNTQPVWLGMAVYYLMYYNQSLNMMRQWIAMAFLFYGFRFLTSDRYRRYFLNLVIAFLFHSSAVLGIAIFFVYRLVAKENAYNKKVKALLLVLIGVCSILSLDFFAGIVSWLGLRYDFYISGALKLMPNQILYRLPILLLLAFRWKYLKRTDQHANFYLVMLVYDLLASQLTSIYANSGRIGLFFSEYYMLAYPALCVSSTSKKNRQAMRLFVLCYLCVYWWYTYVYMGSSATVPYVSIF